MSIKAQLIRSHYPYYNSFNVVYPVKSLVSITCFFFKKHCSIKQRRLQSLITEYNQLISVTYRFMHTWTKTHTFSAVFCHYKIIILHCRNIFFVCMKLRESDFVLMDNLKPLCWICFCISVIFKCQVFSLKELYQIRNSSQSIVCADDVQHWWKANNLTCPSQYWRYFFPRSFVPISASHYEHSLRWKCYKNIMLRTILDCPFSNKISSRHPSIFHSNVTLC